MLLFKDLVYRNNEINIFINNSGEHPAKDVNITMVVAPSAKPAQSKIARSSTFANIIGPGHGLTLILNRNDKEDKKLSLFFKYKDAFTNKMFKECFWLKYEKESRSLYEPTIDEIKEFVPHTQAKLKELSNQKLRRMSDV
ncbi:MAG TPA: hypothetical protein VGB72_08985 [Acidobacteriota bacterium]